MAPINYENTLSSIGTQTFWKILCAVDRTKPLAITLWRTRIHIHGIVCTLCGTMLEVDELPFHYWIDVIPGQCTYNGPIIVCENCITHLQFDNMEATTLDKHKTINTKITNLSDFDYTFH